MIVINICLIIYIKLIEIILNIFLLVFNLLVCFKGEIYKIYNFLIFLRIYFYDLNLVYLYFLVIRGWWIF